MNHVSLMGNLVRDPELRKTKSGKSVVNFAIAVNRFYKDGNGERQSETTYVECEAWDSGADIIDKYFQKGKAILVEGCLKQHSWEDQEGNRRTKLKVRVEKFHFVSRGEANAPSKSDEASESVADEAIPF